MTYFRRIYHPFMLQQPSLHDTAAGSFMLWTHGQPGCAQAAADSDAVLGAAAVIPALADLAETASALQALIGQQGPPLAEAASALQALINRQGLPCQQDSCHHLLDVRVASNSVLSGPSSCVKRAQGITVQGLVLDGSRCLHGFDGVGTQRVCWGLLQNLYCNSMPTCCHCRLKPCISHCCSFCFVH